MTPILSIAACVWILYGLPPNTWLWFGIWVVAVLSFYFLWSRHHSALNDGGDGYIPGAAAGDDDVMATRPQDGPP